MLPVLDPDGPAFTTTELVATERRALDLVAARADERAAALPAAVAARAAARSGLRPDQQRMLFALLTCGRGVDVVTGPAGSGKTAALRTATLVWQRAGLPWPARRVNASARSCSSAIPRSYRNSKPKGCSPPCPGNPQRCTCRAITGSGPRGSSRPSTRYACWCSPRSCCSVRTCAFDSAFHWGAHFLVAVALSAVVLCTYLLVAGRPAPGQLLTILGLHLYAMFPDLLFRWGIPHARWMNVFAGHIAVHYLPGGDRSWLAVAVLAVAGYVLLLARWVSAREREATAGLAPGLGLGGSAVWRAQSDPRTTLLGHTRHGEAAPTVVLLHGLGGTQVVWQPVAELLALDGVPSVRVDLLGFGASLGIGTRFAPHGQAEALARLLEGQTRNDQREAR